jgi:tetratricopeptide (TPR) repeat protein
MRQLLSTLIFVLYVCTAIAGTNQIDSVRSEPVVAAISTDGASSEQLLELAAANYSKGNYVAAAQQYETILKRVGASEALFYNLGNAYFKSDCLAPAILNYERALRLNPADGDARFNLEMCQARIVDKIDPIGMFLIVRWYHALGNLQNSNGWATTSILFFILFIGSLFAYFFARRRFLKKFGFFFGIAMLAFSSLSMVYSAQESQRLTHSDEAILFTLSVTVKSSPDKSGTDLFVLHEGTKMTVRSELGDWSEIELEDGNIGWLLSKDIQRI